MTKRQKFWVRGLGGAVLGGLLAAGYHWAQNPTSGGGKADNFFARRAKNRAYASVSPTEDAQSVRLSSANGNGWFNITPEPIQGFDRYQSQKPNRPTPTRRVLVLQPLGEFNSEEKWLLEACREYCEAFFGLPTRVAAPMGAPPVQKWPSHFGSQKMQWAADEILERTLAPRLPDDAAAFIGLTNADLKVPGLAFVFGLGDASSRVGVYSFARYGLKPGATEGQKRLALRRTCQVLNHETGHVFGIQHCVFYKCSMNGSNSLPDSDDTPMEYCPICRRKLAWNIGYNSTKRDADLAAFYRKFGLEKWLISVVNPKSP